MTTFSVLKADAVTYSARSDVTALMNTFVRTAERRVYRRLRMLEQEQEATLTLTSADSYAVDLPERFLGARSIYVTNESAGRPDAVYVPPDRFHEMNTGTLAPINYNIDGRTPYTVEAGKVKVATAAGATDDISVTMIYYQRFAPLGDSNTTNAALTAHFDLFLYATLEQIWRYLRNGEQLAISRNMVSEIFGEIEDEEFLRRLPAGGAVPVRRASRVA